MLPRPPHYPAYPIHADPPPAHYHAYGTMASFSSGSSMYGHEAHSLPAPTNLVGATAGTSAPSGYPYASYSYSPMPLFPTPPLVSISRMDISHSARMAPSSDCPPPPSSSSSSSQPMAVSSSFASSASNVHVPALSTTSSSSEYHRRSEEAAAGASSPSRRGSASRDDNSADSKEKKHSCWMCHKSFDRPSTLRKHLLVHTGEKAYVCKTCDRRFGVQSNLNRHAKRCVLRPVNSPKAPSTVGSAGASTSEQALEGTTVPVTPVADSPEVQAVSPVEVPRTRKRKSAARDPTTDDSVTEVAPTRQKRCRRAPSPSRWVPESLRLFDLTPLSKSTPVPLPPVQPFGELEERDSLDENVAIAPYHPEGWTGRLPGPGVMERDITNTNGGRILIF